MGIASTTTKAQANLNDYIYVKLTGEGYQLLIDQRNEFRLGLPQKTLEYVPVETVESIKATEDENGYKAFQMWDFVNIFGQSLRWGKNPLDLNVLIDVKIPDELEYVKSLNASLLHQLELKDKEIAMLQANITNISKP